MLLNIAGHIISLSLLVASASINAKTIATDSFITPTRSSTSISLSNKPNLDKTSRDEMLKNGDTDLMPALIKEGSRIESTSASVDQLKGNNSGLTTLSVTTPSHDFTLFDANTSLISDFNYDGFYHRFSVTFDADTVYDVAYVYVKIYLSYEGGPWNHYATSDNYHIYLDNENDEMTIETELADGFAPGYYDIRIELYDADYNEWLLSYGPYDDPSLSSLPLEDSYYDDDINGGSLTTEIIVSGHGHGAMSWLLFLIPTLMIIVRTEGSHSNKKTIH